MSTDGELLLIDKKFCNRALPLSVFQVDLVASSAKPDGEGILLSHMILSVLKQCRAAKHSCRTGFSH